MFRWVHIKKEHFYRYLAIICFAKLRFNGIILTKAADPGAL